MKKTLLLTALFFGLVAAVLAQKNTPQVRYHTKLQNSVSFEARSRENEAFTLASAKEDLRAARKAKRENEKAKREKERVAAIYAEIAKLKEDE